MKSLRGIAVPPFFALCALWGLWPLSLSAAHAATAPEPNVILITVDGVRWQEVFHGPDPDHADGDSAPTFPILFSEMLQNGVLFGNVDEGNPMFVANWMKLSLPAYMSILGGQKTWCFSNDCDPIDFETLQERLVRELQLPKEKVATFASWDRIARASEHIPGSTTLNVSTTPFQDSLADVELDRLNTAQGQDLPPWGDARFDKYTYAQSMRYLLLHRPRFLYISFDDSDEHGHRNEYSDYLTSLRQYDVWLKEIVETLKTMKGYGENTTILLTTDHGRGDGISWSMHGPWLPEARYIWLYARNAATHGQPQANPAEPYSHLDIRPTVEKLLGLTPLTCDGCGRAMSEIAP